MGAKEDREGWTNYVTKKEMAKSIASAAKRSKYGAIRTEAGGRVFDSRREAEHYMELALRQAAKEISGLRFQPEFVLWVTPLDGRPAVNVGSYFADFEYLDEKAERVVVDVKSKATSTPLYRLKKKIVTALYGIDIKEV